MLFWLDRFPRNGGADEHCLRRRDFIAALRGVARAVLHDVHRIRDIATDRDGLVYVLTDSGDLLRLVPTR